MSNWLWILSIWAKGLEWLLKHNFYWCMKRSLHTKSSGKEHRLRPPGFKSSLHSLPWGLRCFLGKFLGFPGLCFLIVVVQSLSGVWLFATPRTTVHQASLSFTISLSLLKLMSMSWWCYLTISSSVALFSSYPQSFPASGKDAFQTLFNELALHIKGPKYWSFSFSISPSNENSGLISFRIDWFDFLGVKGLSRVSSSITVRKHQFFSTQPSLWPWYNFIHILSDLHSSQWS